MIILLAEYIAASSADKLPSRPFTRNCAIAYQIIAICICDLAWLLLLTMFVYSVDPSFVFFSSWEKRDRRRKSL